ncbi:MAG: cupredoxin domain-containing protein [Acidimicrobiales bacterium]|nr:cupredoxin domain-containing protein [Acidimicrobiales bacterium]
MAAASPEVPDGHTGDGGVDPDVEHEAWRQLLFWVGLADVVVAGALLVVAGRIYLPVALFVPLFLAGLVLLVRPGGVGPVTLGAASVLFVVVNLRLLVDDLAHPDTFVTFFPAAIGVVAGCVGAVGLAGFLRRWPVRATGRVGVVASALVLVALGVGLSATFSVADDVPQEGDLALVAEADEWAPDTLTAREAGDIAVYVTNADLRRHTFTIDVLDVSVELPADTSRRVAFTAPAGEYEFRSDVPGQTDMTGTLTVPG